MHQWLWKERDLVFARIYAFGSQRVNDALDAWYSPNPSMTRGIDCSRQ